MRKKAIQFFLSSLLFLFDQSIFHFSLYININTYIYTQVKEVEVFSRRWEARRGEEDRVVNRSVKRFTGIACHRRWWVKARVAREKSWRGCDHVLDREFIIPEQLAGWSGRTVGCTPEAISSRALLL